MRYNWVFQPASFPAVKRETRSVGREGQACRCFRSVCGSDCSDRSRTGLRCHRSRSGRCHTDSSRSWSSELLVSDCSCVVKVAVGTKHVTGLMVHGHVKTLYPSGPERVATLAKARSRLARPHKLKHEMEITQISGAEAQLSSHDAELEQVAGLLQGIEIRIG